MLRGTIEKNILSTKGSLICPPGKSLINFHKKQIEKIELVTRLGGQTIHSGKKTS